MGGAGVPLRYRCLCPGAAVPLSSGPGQAQGRGLVANVAWGWALGRWVWGVGTGQQGRQAEQAERTAYTFLRPATHLVRRIVITSAPTLQVSGRAAWQGDYAASIRWCLCWGGWRATGRPRSDGAAGVVRRHARVRLLLLHIPGPAPMSVPVPGFCSPGPGRAGAMGREARDGGRSVKAEVGEMARTVKPSKPSC